MQATATKSAATRRQSSLSVTQRAVDLALRYQPVVVEVAFTWLGHDIFWLVESHSEPGTFHPIWLVWMGGRMRLMCPCKARRSGKITCHHAQAVRLKLIAARSSVEKAGASAPVRVPEACSDLIHARNAGRRAEWLAKLDIPVVFNVVAPVEPTPPAPPSPPTNQADEHSGGEDVCPLCLKPAPAAELEEFGVCRECAAMETGQHCVVCGSSFDLSASGHDCPLGHPQPQGLPHRHHESESDVDADPAPDPEPESGSGSSAEDNEGHNEGPEDNEVQSITGAHNEGQTPRADIVPAPPPPEVRIPHNEAQIPGEVASPLPLALSADSAPPSPSAVAAPAASASLPDQSRVLRSALAGEGPSAEPAYTSLDEAPISVQAEYAAWDAQQAVQEAERLARESLAAQQSTVSPVARQAIERSYVAIQQSRRRALRTRRQAENASIVAAVRASMPSLCPPVARPSAADAAWYRRMLQEEYPAPGFGS